MAPRQQPQPSCPCYPPEQPGVRLLRRLGGKPVSSKFDEEIDELQRKLLKMRCPQSIAFWEYPIGYWRKNYQLVRGIRYQREGLGLLKKHGLHMNPENRTILIVQDYRVNQRLNAILEDSFISKEDYRLWKQMAKSFCILAEMSSRDAQGREVEFEFPPLMLDDSQPSSGRSTPGPGDHATSPKADRIQEYIEVVVPSANVCGLDLAVTPEELVHPEDRESYMPLVSNASSFFPLISRDDLSILTSDTGL
ncbi:hypothetical protein L227DRAFT_602373 [Lentinus tigrinus ALCF2SS1-6]|uniref:Uncharacterized protein n=1 Tax=Lentinus tigrinus ALCF2SS1-6 TaxID=1328759 RepID=A0A5C2S256_9APHY|nr:hypothetical protein L227DRAFT_602373 [Lentinus tigrinus ALCF2SS1-6]